MNAPRFEAAPIAERYDVAVIGAGPAGMAAAADSAAAGLATVLFDEQPAPGGQIYRGITETPLQDRDVLGKDYWYGEQIAQRFAASGAQYVPGATVWSLSRERELGVSVGGGSRLLSASRVILATGALERPFPIPGWTLPGVMTAGAAQIMLKTGALVPQGKTVLAGCGPLLWLLAAQLLKAGTKVDLLLDTTPAENRKRAAPHLWPFLRSPYFGKGLSLLRAVRAKVRIVSGVTAVRAEGEGKLQRVAWQRGSSTEESAPVDNLLLHQGVVPNVNLAMSVGIEHRWDDLQLCFTPVVDDAGNTSVDGIGIAGDGAGIAGAQAAEFRGRLAALAAVRALKPSAPHADEAQLHRELSRYIRGRRFVDELYRPSAQFRVPQGDTIVCRCEEVTAQQVNETVALGCPGPNQMKSFLRCGMGPCQGRLCGLTVTEMIAEHRGVSRQEVGYYRLRPPVKPITVAELASLPKNDAAVKAVVRL